MNVLCVVGARPNFMKAAPVIAALERRSGVAVTLVHTGQHYDRQMSELFFEELGMPRPDLDLQVGSGAHGEQTGHIMIRLEPVLLQARPDLVMVFGDVNSTVAGALVAAKLGIPVAHVEAGLRSFDRTMPEELNRIVTDHLCDLLFVTEPSGMKNLLAEGIPRGHIHFVGNVMVDTLLTQRERAVARSYAAELGLVPKTYALLTLHRPSNVDDPKTLGRILDAVEELSARLPVVFPCHPRTRRHMIRFAQGADGRPGNGNGSRHKGVWLLDPLGYLEFLSLMIEARLVLTDSGGIQEETTVLGVPCLTLRENTERPVTVEQGTNVLVGNARERILAGAARALDGGVAGGGIPELWDGMASERIADILVEKIRPARDATGREVPAEGRSEAGSPA